MPTIEVNYSELETLLGIELNDDMERLEPGEFLNDSLVDFWMKW